MEAGEYELKVWFEHSSGLASDTTAASYTVMPVDLPAMDLLAQAARAVWNAEAWTPLPTVDPDTLIAQALASSLPAYAEELGPTCSPSLPRVQAAGNGSEALQEKANRLYGDFLAAYPSSTYAPSARSGSFSSLPEIPSSDNVSPMCDGREATIYVYDGLVVGGRDDGQAYAGNADRHH